MNIWIAAALGIFVFTVAAGFIHTTEAAWYAGQRIYIPVLLGVGLGSSLGLGVIGLTMR
jgi:hypothetical protein